MIFKLQAVNFENHMDKVMVINLYVLMIHLVSLDKNMEVKNQFTNLLIFEEAKHCKEVMKKCS